MPIYQCPFCQYRSDVFFDVCPSCRKSQKRNDKVHLMQSLSSLKKEDYETSLYEAKLAMEEKETFQAAILMLYSDLHVRDINEYDPIAEEGEYKVFFYRKNPVLQEKFTAAGYPVKSPVSETHVSILTNPYYEKALRMSGEKERKSLEMYPEYIYRKLYGHLKEDLENGEAELERFLEDAGIAAFLSDKAYRDSSLLYDRMKEELEAVEFQEENVTPEIEEERKEETEEDPFFDFGEEPISSAEEEEKQEEEKEEILPDFLQEEKEEERKEPKKKKADAHFIFIYALSFLFTAFLLVFKYFTDVSMLLLIILGILSFGIVFFSFFVQSRYERMLSRPVFLIGLVLGVLMIAGGAFLFYRTINYEAINENYDYGLADTFCGCFIFSMGLVMIIMLFVRLRFKRRIILTSSLSLIYIAAIIAGIVIYDRTAVHSYTGYAEGGTALTRVTSEKEEYTLPSGVSSISVCAFRNTNIKKVHAGSARILEGSFSDSKVRFLYGTDNVIEEGAFAGTKVAYVILNITEEVKFTSAAFTDSQAGLYIESVSDRSLLGEFENTCCYYSKAKPNDHDYSYYHYVGGVPVKW